MRLQGAMLSVMVMLVVTLFSACAKPTVLRPRPVDDQPVVEYGFPDAKAPPLCLSGGGFRAMLFHAGVLAALNDLHVLPEIRRFSSVSGGSITQAQFALRYTQLNLDSEAGRFSNLDDLVIRPLETAATRETIDYPSLFAGMATPGFTPSAFLVRAYDRVFFHSAKLRDLPNPGYSTRAGLFPVFVFRSTELGTGLPWDFTNSYMGSDELGKLPVPDVPISLVVAASSAFPPVFPPIRMNLVDMRHTQLPGYAPIPNVSKQKEDRLLNSKAARLDAVTDELALSDGAVYDNLGLSGCLGENLEGPAIVSNAAPLKVPRVLSPDGGWIALSMASADLLQSRANEELLKRVAPLSRADIYALTTQLGDLSDQERAGAIDEILRNNTDRPSLISLSDLRSVMLWLDFRANLGSRARDGRAFSHPHFSAADLPRLTCLASVDTRLARLSPATATAIIDLGYIQTFATLELKSWSTALARANQEAGPDDEKVDFEATAGNFKLPREFPSTEDAGCDDVDLQWLQQEVSLIESELNDEVDLKTLIKAHPPR